MNGVVVGSRAGDTLELFSWKDLHVEQKFYWSASALKVGISLLQGNRELSTLKIVQRGSECVHCIVRSQLSQESFVRSKLEGIKQSLIALRFCAK